MYCIGSLTSPTASLILLMASASAFATLIRASASPSARSIADFFSPSALLICDSLYPSASRICAFFKPSASRIFARRSRSEICFHGRGCHVGVMSCSRPCYFNAPLLVASSRMIRNLLLITSREERVSSRSISPITFLKVVWVSFSMASGRFWIS